MTTSRIRNYVKKNPETVENWKYKVLRYHLIRLITEAHGNEETPSADFNIYSITGNRGQDNICRDVLYDHFDLCSEYTKEVTKWGTKVLSLRVYDEAFYPMIEEIGEVKPEFPTMDVDKKEESDIYVFVKNISLPALIYIFNHQDEFVFINKINPSRYSYRSNRGIGGLGVFWKDQAEEADNLAFRNAIDDYYGKRLDVIGPIVCEKEFPDLVEKDWEAGKDRTVHTSDFKNFHLSLLPKSVDDFNVDNIQYMIERAEHGIAETQKTLQQLHELKASILEAGGDAAFRDLYYAKMIPAFYRSTPLFINTEDTKLKKLAKRAMKNKYH